MNSAHFRRRRQAMPQWVAALVLVLAASLAAADPESPPSQPSESHTDSAITDAQTGSPGDALLQPQPAAMPGSSDSNAAAEAEVLHRFNELRREFLDHRAKTVDWWLTATAIFLTLLGIVAVLAGYFSFKGFRKIETKVRKNLESSKAHAETAQGLVDEIKARRDEAKSLVQEITAASVRDNPDKVRRATEHVQENPTASPIDQAVAAAVQLQQQGKIKESIEKWHAIAIISEEIDRDRAARAWFSVGYLRQEHEEDALEAAIDAYNKSIRLKPDLAEAYNNRGSAKDGLGRHEEAIADHDEAIRLKPDYAMAYNNRGVAKNNLGRHEEAIADHNEAIRLKPDYAMAHSNRGVAKNNLGRHEEAIADYDEAIRLKPDYAMAYNNRGNAKDSLGRRKEAIVDHDEAIRLKPDYAMAYNNRGVAKNNLGRHEEAIADHDEAIRLKPDLAEAYNNRGNAKDSLGRRGEAIADYDKAIRLKPDYAIAYNNRGRVNILLNRLDKARWDFESTITLAREAGNEALTSAAERALKELPGE